MRNYIKTFICVIILFFILISCKNNLNNAERQTVKRTINLNELYDESLVVETINDLDEKYNNLCERILDMKMVSEYETDKTVEDFDTVFFGRKEQDGIYENGDEDIEWILLYRDEEKALLQTKYIIDEMQYIEIDKQYNLLEYLNKKYINEIFNSEEVSLLKNIKVEKKVNNSSELSEDESYYNFINFQEDRKINLINCNDIIKYYGDAHIVDYNKYNEYNNEKTNIATNSKIITYETNYVKKIIHNDNTRKQSTYYMFQEEENYKNKNINIDKYHHSKSNYYYLDSSLIYNFKNHPSTYIGVDAVSNEGIILNNFYAQSDYEWLRNGDKVNYLAGIRPIIYIDLEKAKNFKIQNEYKKYKYCEIKKGEIFDIKSIERVHRVSDYPDNTYLENIETVSLGTVSNAEGNNPIEWLVLDKNDDAYLLMSKYPISLKRFDEEGRNVDYLDSSIRKWLNEDFFNKAFGDEIKNKIKTVKYNLVYKNISDKNSLKQKDKEEDLEDRIFLLSENDINKYFSKNSINNDDFNFLDEKKLLSNTMNFNYEICSVHREPFYGKWNDFNQGFLIRDNGKYNHLVKYIDNEGKMNENGTLIDIPYMPIRPAIYVSDKNVNIKIDYEKKFANEINYGIKEIEEINNIYIGRCEQDGNRQNGQEDIEWEVIGREDDDLILISKYILDAEKLNNQHKICKYENSVIRKKLQNLYNEYFNDKEKDLLIERNNENYKSILDGENGSEITKEKLFILSIDDIRKYIGDTNKAYDILKSENTYYLSIRDDIQRLPKDLYLKKNYFLRSVGSVNYDYYIQKLTFNNMPIKDSYNGYDDIFWSNVDENGKVNFININDYCDTTKYTDYVKGYLDILIDDMYYNGIRPCIKVNINKLRAYLNEEKKINPYMHKKLEKGKVYKIENIDNVKILKQNEDYIVYDNIDTIKFGKYDLKVSTSSDIEWFVLYKDKDRALLLSKYLIDEGHFDYNDVWEFSDIRRKLNEEFYDNSFTIEEKNRILTTKSNPINGNIKETFDKIFLPDEKLLNDYVLDGNIKDERYVQKYDRLKVSKYIKDYVVNYNANHEYGKLDFDVYEAYCLNDNNTEYEFSPIISDNGKIYFDNTAIVGIRPAIWIKLNDNLIDEFEVKPKIKKYNDDDTIEEKISKSLDISKYNDEQTVEDFDTVCFGKFFQREDESEKQDIEWIILNKNDEYAILMSKYILYSMSDSETKKEQDNNNSEFIYAYGSTRKWLNEEFYDTAFNEDEKKKLKTMSLVDVSQNGSNEIKTFYDNVIILNSIELAKYFGYISKNDVNKKIPTKATKYALNRIRYGGGLKVFDYYDEYGYGNSNFAIRSYSRKTKIIDSGGKISDGKYENIVGLRPVIKINLKNLGTGSDEFDKNSIYYDKDLNKIIETTNTFKETSETKPIPDTIIFGRYEQDNNLDNGKEDIEWYILKKEKGKALIISKDILDCKMYDSDRDRTYRSIDSKYYGSFINEWLNIKFINDAFDENEIKLIRDTVLYDEEEEYNYAKKEYEKIKNYYLTKVFIPSLDEIDNYLSDGIEMRAGAYANEYVKNMENGTSNIFIYEETGLSPYWTRSIKKEDSYTGYNRIHVVIASDGTYEKVSSNNTNIGVRPVMWISIN